MMDHWMLMELAKARQADLLAEAARERLANQLRPSQPRRATRPLAAVGSWVRRLCQPVGLRIRRPA
ncbi:MAG TPA: hypothetical protein VKV73_07270 [Chloroflexota bacterium]|nr:hypothetical protein [Chloroflexota bacterium]